MRKGEAARVTWGDCDFEHGKIHVKGDPDFGTKNWDTRVIPMLPEMRLFLERLRRKRPSEDSTASVREIRECQKAIDSAVKKIGSPRVTHHDLRHLFATRCLEAGVDVPTVSRWLGHKDGGSLVMKTYGHLRDEHSTDMAARVNFGLKG